MSYEALKRKFKEVVNKYHQAHVDLYGPPVSHSYAQRSYPSAGDCPLSGN